MFLITNQSLLTLFVVPAAYLVLTRLEKKGVLSRLPQAIVRAIEKITLVLTQLKRS